MEQLSIINAPGKTHDLLARGGGVWTGHGEEESGRGRAIFGGRPGRGSAPQAAPLGLSPSSLLPGSVNTDVPVGVPISR